MIGQIVLYTKVNGNELELNLSNLQAGTYAKIESNKATEVFKLIKI